MLAQTLERDSSYKQTLNQAREVEGQLFVCNVSLYRNLFNQVFLKSSGDLELAKNTTFQAAANDGIALIQENISALDGIFAKDNTGQLSTVDLKIKASMQQTPTRHTYIQTIDSDTGESVITSPEYLFLGKSITTALTGWRRGNDKAVMGLVEKLALNLPETDQNKVDYTLFWASPKAEEWEDPLIRKYNGEYGYLYTGHLTEEARVRKMVVHSYKADLETAAYLNFLTRSKGETHHADEASSERPFLDSLMRTVVVVRGAINDTEVISKLYQAKQETEGVNRMFGIKQETIQDIQDPDLRERIKKEVSIPVANWLVEQIVSRVSDEVIQSQIRDKYIELTKDLVRTIKEEEQAKEYQFISNMTIHEIALDKVEDEKAVLKEDLRKMVVLKGEFCGGWGGGSSRFGGGVVSDLQNYTGISGLRINSQGGFRSGKVCVKCGEMNECTSVCWKPHCKGMLL